MNGFLKILIIIFVGVFAAYFIYQKVAIQLFKEKSNLIVVDTPLPHQFVKSPLVIKGRARGFWYFEASFPVRLFDGNKKEIAVGIAEALSDWMTKEFVPFQVILEFSSPTTESGILVLEKSNPSDLPEQADRLEIPVRFDFKNASKSKECIITGCSSEICAEEEMVSICEYRTEYACYRSAQCERQSNGKCGWVLSEELNNCLKRAK